MLTHLKCTNKKFFVVNILQKPRKFMVDHFDGIVGVLNRRIYMTLKITLKNQSNAEN